MGRIISFANQKGGVGKTTTAINIAACLATENKNTLLVDIDPQGNVATGLGIESQKLQYTIYDCLINDMFADEVIVQSDIPNLSLLPSNIHLSGAQVNMLDGSLYPGDSKFSRLRNVLEPLRERYDFIIIDCPPSLDILTLNSLVSSTDVMVPLQCEFYALEGLRQIMNTIAMIKNSFNPDLNFSGVILTMYDSRTNLSQQVVDDVKGYFSSVNGHVFETIIPRNVQLSEAPSFGKPVTLYAPHSRGAQSYVDLTKEIINYVN